MYKLIIDEIPPSNNKFQGTGNRYAYQNIKKYWAELIIYNSLMQIKNVRTFEKSIVELHYFFKDKRRRDPDNYSGKFILDGLVKAKLIKDDSFDNIELVLKGGYDKGNSRLEIKIKEVK